MIEPINFAIVGCGRIAERHAEQIRRIGRLVAVCDIIPERSKALGGEYGTPYFENIDDLLRVAGEANVIVVCSPNGLHAEHCIKALKAGFHVLCEKPMSIAVVDCIEMIRAAEKAGKQLFIVKQNRFNPPVKALKQLVDEGRLGKIYSLQLNCFWNRNADYYEDSWRGTLRLDGGTLFTQFSHFIDLLYWILGDVKDLMAMAANFAHEGVSEFEDTGVVLLQFQNGCLGTLNFTINSYAKNMEGSLTIFAEKGTVKVGGQYLNRLEYQRVEGYEIRDLAPGNDVNNYGNYEGSMSNHDKVYDNLVEVLQHNGTISANAFEGMKTVEIIERIYKAARASESYQQHG